MSTWNIDPTHSSINFAVRHMVISKVHGRFTKFSATANFDPASPEASTVEAQIDTASIDTHEAQRDGHLKSPDFLDAEKFPHITFKSTSVKASGDDYEVAGDISIHGVTQPVVLHVESGGTSKDPWGNTRAGFSARTSIDRKAFGLSWNQVLEAGGLLVGEKVEITIEAELIQAKPAT